MVMAKNIMMFVGTALDSAFLMSEFMPELDSQG